MSHEIETMAWVNEVPWHGLGKRVHPDLTPAQMMVEAGLDWTVSKHPCTYMYQGDQHRTGKQALVRDTDGKMLDVVSDDWQPLQNQEAFEFFSEFVMAGNMEMNTAGSLKEGRIVWGLAKVKDSFELFGGDQVESYLLFTNPHTFGKSIDVRFTPIRVVCNNTLSMSLGQKVEKMVKITHRRKFEAESVKHVLGIAHQKLEAYKETAEFLGSKRYTDESADAFFKAVFPTGSTKKANELSLAGRVAKSVVETQPGNQFARGSFWQLVNSITYYADHIHGRNQDNRLTNAWYGGMAETKLKAIRTAIDLATVA